MEDIPFELLFASEQECFVGADYNFGLVRKYAQHDPPDPIKSPLRLLAVVSNPHPEGDMRLDTAEEVKRLRRAIERIEKSGELAIEFDILETGAASPDDTPTPRSFRRRLRDELTRPHVIHFIGHGYFENDTGFLEFERDPSKDLYGLPFDPVHPLSSKSLRRTLQSARPWLVVLNSCEGANANRDANFGGTAQTLVTIGVPFVVAMGSSITDDAAKSFAEAFYPALFKDRILTRAMAEGRMEVLEETLDAPELHTPILFTCVDTDRIAIADPPLPQADNGGAFAANDNSRWSKYKKAGSGLAVLIGALAGVATIHQSYFAASDRSWSDAAPPVLADRGPASVSDAAQVDDDEGDTPQAGARDDEDQDGYASAYWERSDPIYPEDKDYLEQIVRSSRAAFADLERLVSAARLPDGPSSQQAEDFALVVALAPAVARLDRRIEALVREIRPMRTGEEVRFATGEAEDLRRQVLDLFEAAAQRSGLARERFPMASFATACRLNMPWSALNPRPHGQSAALFAYAAFQAGWARCREIHSVYVLGVAEPGYPALEALVRSRTSARVIERQLQRFGQGALVSARALGTHADGFVWSNGDEERGAPAFSILADADLPPATSLTVRPDEQDPDAPVALQMQASAFAEAAEE